ncbi:probable carboxylesterase 12 [Olea europaea var. sylvestris]|uniref:probable carboxylesterase 12 n=1 Tax=Olea europaea var. sylvestris TaxID=158386 RepID=UPI000C1D2BC3|nr:probable carboxylesterase 12 [Olea europaea var. sylvestris]
MGTPMHTSSSSSDPSFQLKIPSYPFFGQASNTSFEVDDPDRLYDISPFVRVYKCGRVERFFGTERVSASLDPTTGVESKDIEIQPDLTVSVRIFTPPRHINYFNRRRPLLIYIHGGGFVTESAFSPTYQRFLNELVAESKVVAVSIEYRLAPENLLPIAYEDSWLALNWVASHFEGNGDEIWLNENVDFESVYLGGDSAGANIVHNMAMRVGLESDKFPIKLSGAFLNCPHFLGKDPIGSEAEDDKMKNIYQRLWLHMYPDSEGLDDPSVNPAMDPRLSSLGCKRMLIFVAELDSLRDRGYFYQKSLSQSNWMGDAVIEENEGEGHVFNLICPENPKAIEMMKKIAAFLQTNRTL